MENRRYREVKKRKKRKEKKTGQKRTKRRAQCRPEKGSISGQFLSRSAMLDSSLRRKGQGEEDETGPASERGSFKQFYNWSAIIVPYSNVPSVFRSFPFLYITWKFAKFYTFLSLVCFFTPTALSLFDHFGETFYSHNIIARNGHRLRDMGLGISVFLGTRTTSCHVVNRGSDLHMRTPMAVSSLLQPRSGRLRRPVCVV